MRRWILCCALLGGFPDVGLIDGLGRGEGHTVLRPARTCKARLNLPEVQLQDVGVDGCLLALVAPHALRLGVRGDEIDALARPPRKLQVAQRLLIDGKDAAGAAVFRRHVRDRRAVRQRQVRQAVAEELHELVDDALLAQLLRHGQHQIRGGRSGLELPREAKADDLRNQHGDRLPQHRRFGLDAADAPAEHAQAVDHRRMRVGADQRVRIGLPRALALGVEDHPPQVLEVDLVDDAGVRRHDLEIAERRLAPAQKGVALAIARELDLVVRRERPGGAVLVDLYGMVYDQLCGGERIHALGVAAKAHDGIAHRSEIDDAGDASEILEDDARGRERDFVGRRRRRIPVQERFDVGPGDVHAILEPQQVLQENLQGIGQALHLLARQRRQAPDFVGAVAHLQRRTRLEAVRHEASGKTCANYTSMTAPPRHRSAS